MKPERGRSRPRWVGLVLLALATTSIVAAALFLEGWEGMDPLRQALPPTEVDARAFGVGKLDRLLFELGVIHAVTFDEETARRSGVRDGPAKWRVGKVDAESLPSSLAVPRQVVESGVRVLSLVLEPEDWEFLETHARGRGLESERPAYASLYEGGELLLASGVGVRVHGGRSRRHESARSLRLYFDRSYGIAGAPASRFGWQHGGEVDRLVVHNDLRWDYEGAEWRSASPLAYDLARQIGALAPETSPALLFVNGEPYGLFFLTERLDSDYLQRHFGHEDFVFLRTKSDVGARRWQQGNRDLFLWLQARVRALPGSELDQLETLVDVDNLIRWFLSVAFCGTTDPFQGPLLRDASSPTGRWFWVNWDMDHSFMNTRASALPPWEIDLFSWILEGRHPDLRAILLRRLWKGSPEFRGRVSSAFEEMLDQRLTDDFLDERYAHYRRVAAEYEVDNDDYLGVMGEFLVRRKAVVRRQMKGLLATSSSD